MIFDRKRLISLVAALGAASVVLAPVFAQAPAQSPAKPYIDSRKGAYALIGANFRPLGAVLKGDKPYEAEDVEKRITRLVFLASLLEENFPELSNVGLPETKAKADAWTKREDFIKKLKDFQEDLAALEKVNATEKRGSDAFKTALKTVAQDCKSCHDDFREK